MTAIEVRDDGAFLRAELVLPGCSPEGALAAFTSPEVLAGWWQGELTTELAPGGPYEVWFAKVPARMTGRVIRYVPSSVLEFSWAWDYPADPPEIAVTVRAGTAADGSATLEVMHGPHGDDADGRVARAQHREGWEYFLPQLPAAVNGVTGPA